MWQGVLPGETRLAHFKRVGTGRNDDKHFEPFPAIGSNDDKHLEWVRLRGETDKHLKLVELRGKDDKQAAPGGRRCFGMCSKSN